MLGIIMLMICLGKHAFMGTSVLLVYPILDAGTK